MLRRLVGLAGFLALSAMPVSQVAAQCCSLDLSPYSSMFRGITEPSLMLQATGVGGPFDIKLTVVGQDPFWTHPYALIGTPSAPNGDEDNDGTPEWPTGTTYGFGANGEWANRTGIFLGSAVGTLRFDFVGFQTSAVRVFVQFGTDCFTNPDLEYWPPLCDEPGFEPELPFIRAIRADATYEDYYFGEADLHPGTDTGAYYTLSTTGAGFVAFEATGSYIAVGAMEVVPEPGTVVLLATGLAGIAGFGLRRRRRR
jgi:hypothetical protein